MNHLAVVLVWCVLQVTLLSLLAAAAYLLLRRFGPKAGILVLMTSLLLIIGLSLMMFSPWPRWMGTAEARPFSAKKAALAMASKRDAPGPVGAKHPVKGDGADHLASSEQSAHAAPVGQPALALWLQSMRDELTLRRPVTAAEEPITERRASWPIAIVAVLLLAAAFGLIRLIVGLIVVRQYRHQSTVIRDPRLSEMTDLLLAELGCRRRLELRELAALVSAATVGWRRPIILLPGRWTIWSDQQLRAILAHELAHVRSNDFLAGLLGQIGLALHFYHPLVHWLMGRLKLEQELAADSVAAQLSGGPGIYLTTIAEMALAQDDHNVGWPARAFLPARSTLLRRISMLRNSQSPIAPISRGVRVISICVMLLLGLAVAGLRPGVSPGVEAQAEEPAKEQAPETRSSDRQKALNLLNKTIAHSGDQLIRKGEFTYEVTSKGEVPTASEIAELNRRTREQLLAASEAATDPKQKAYLKSLAEEDNDYGPAMIANAHLKLQFYFACDGSSVGGDHYWSVERETLPRRSWVASIIFLFVDTAHEHQIAYSWTKIAAGRWGRLKGLVSSNKRRTTSAGFQERSCRSVLNICSLVSMKSNSLKDYNSTVSPQSRFGVA